MRRPLLFRGHLNRQGRKAAKMASRSLEPLRRALGQLTPQEQLAKTLAERADLQKTRGFWPRSFAKGPNPFQA